MRHRLNIAIVLLAIGGVAACQRAQAHTHSHRHAHGEQTHEHEHTHQGEPEHEGVGEVEHEHGHEKGGTAEHDHEHENSGTAEHDDDHENVNENGDEHEHENGEKAEHDHDHENGDEHASAHEHEKGGHGGESGHDGEHGHGGAHDDHGGGGHGGHGGGDEHGHGSGGHESGVTFTTKQQEHVDFAVGEVERRTLQASVPAQGFVRSAPDAKAAVRAPFAGRLLAHGDGMPEVGERVEAGEPVAVIAPTVDTNVLPTLRAEVRQAEEVVERRKREVERLEGLLEDGAIPKTRVLEARSQLESAQAELEAAKRRLSQSQSFQRGGEQGSLTLRAPVSGQVVARGATPEEYVGENSELLRIVDGSRLRLEARVAASDAAEIEEVSGVTVRPDGREKPVALGGEALVAFLDVIDPATRTASAWFRVPGEASGLTAGQYHRVRVQTGSKINSPAVPETAILEEKGMQVVYVAKGPETFERRLVETGIRDGKWVQITEGLKPGDRVVTRGVYYVKLAGATSGVVGHHH